MTPTTVTAHIHGLTIGLIERPLMLDGPLAWVAWQESGLPDTVRHNPIDFDLPLHRWESHGVWGWKVSAGVPVIAAHTAVQIRRKPAVAEFSRYSRDRRHHSGLGPHKARDTIAAAAWITTMTWHAEVTDQPRLEAMLAQLTHLGKHASRGYGQIRSWQVTPGPVDGWQARPLPADHGTRCGVRPPYHHPTRQAVCA